MYILVYMYTYNRVTSIRIDLSKIKLFVFVFDDKILSFLSSNFQNRSYFCCSTWDLVCIR